LRERALNVLFSACLLGETCTWDGRGFEVDLLRRIATHPRVKPLRFCPENFAFGTPRAFSSIHGGHGEDVLDGRAKVVAVDGTDWTEGSIRADRAMAEFARSEKVDLAIMLDISPACGSYVIYLGPPEMKVYQKGFGVAAAAVARAGVPIVAQRDHASLQALMALLEPDFSPDPQAFDFIDHPWYGEYFGRP
jgi:uncharacterized protein YbbK (DUF523 family)